MHQKSSRMFSPCFYNLYFLFVFWSIINFTRSLTENNTARVTVSPNTNIAVVEYDGNIYEFVLNSQSNLIDQEGFHYLIKDGSRHRIKTDLHNQQCIFGGDGTNKNNTHIALVGCQDKFHGLMVTENGDLVLIKPTEKENGEIHLVYKREALINHRGQLVVDKKTKDCFFDVSRGPFAKVSIETHSNPSDMFMAVIKGPLVVELAVFVDQEMWKKFKKQYGTEKAERELENYVLAILNNINLVYNQKSMDPRVIFKLKRYEVLKTSPESLQAAAHQNGDVDLFLTNFCEYQRGLNPSPDTDARHWDHAVLLTGYDLHRGKQVLAAGYAPVKGMCTVEYSCTLAEGDDFGTVYTVAHEIGHSLGMLHDGQNNDCSAQCCIMSYIAGVGKTTWSQCSIKEFNSFINLMGTPPYPDNCLMDGQDLRTPYDSAVNGGALPGQRYTADMQCKIAHGDCNKMELREGHGLDSICEMLYCGDGDGYIRSAEPALDGTYCGNNRWCFDGACKKWVGIFPPGPVNGGWTQWNDAPAIECGGYGCSQCEIKGQLRVRRSVRLCENPSPDNNGKPCPGSAFRGVICDQNKCQGVTPDEFATKNCTALQKTNIVSAKMSLSGQGIQQKDDPCKIWCQTLQDKNFYWTITNFPDGTECGTNKYCLKGECLSLACSNVNLVQNFNDCPGKKDGNSEQFFSTLSSWAAWSSWSSCSKTCGRGVRNRLRTCKGKSCLGLTYDTSTCELKVCDASMVVKSSSAAINEIPSRKNINANPAQTWGTWSPCSRTCNGGQQIRKKVCVRCPNSVETRACGRQLCRT